MDKDTLIAALAFTSVLYLAMKMFLAVMVYRKAACYEEVPAKDDPVIRAQVDAYRAERERARRDYISDLAERGGGNPVNLDGESRHAAEKMGQEVGKFSADVTAKEIEARRKFKLGLFGVATSLVSKA